MTKGTDQAYYNIAKSWVGDATEAVGSADAFYALLRDTPSYIPRRIARDVWREHGQQTAWKEFREARDPSKPLLRRFFHDMPSIAQGDYNATVRISGLDPETGETSETFVTVGFDHAPSMDEIETAALSDEVYLPEGIDPEYMTVGVDYLYHNLGRKW